MLEITFKENTANHENIMSHLQSSDMRFLEELFSRITPDQFVAKLLTNATLLEAWSDGVLIGLLAFYKNDPYYFITNMSVSCGFIKQGVASSLMKICIESRGRNEIRLEVSAENIAAESLYKKFGFVLAKHNDRSNFFVLN